MATYPNQGPPSGGFQPADESESTLSLIRRLIDELATLYRQEIALARAEFSESFMAARTGVASVAAGGAVLFAGFLALLSAAILGLAEVMRPWLAALIVGVVVGGAGYLTFQAGRRKLQPSIFKPTQTRESLRRDKEVLGRRSS
jgi:hypothetical protein